MKTIAVTTMKPAKTAVYMLLAAALGSAATATMMWEMEKRDPLYRLTRGSGTQREYIAKARLPYTIPHAPMEVHPWDLCASYKEQVYDTAIKARGQEYYIQETIDGQVIAYTTDTARSLYHKAISRVTTTDSSNQPTEHKDIIAILDHSLGSEFGESAEVLGDGTPVIDYERALGVLRHTVEHEASP